MRYRFDPARRDLLAGVALACALGPRETAAAVQNTGSRIFAPDVDLPPEIIDLLPNQRTRFAVGVSLNGRGPFSFVVDTGANRSVIADTLAGRLGLPPGPDVLVHGVTAAAAAPTVIVDRVRVAGETDRAIEMPVFPRNQLATDGLLGIDVLGKFRLEFDLRAKTLSMRLGRGEFDIARDMASRIRRTDFIRGERQHGQLVFTDASLDGVPVRAFVDSGSTQSVGNLALLDAVVSRRPFERRWSVPILGVNGREPGEFGVADGLQLGASVLPDAALVFADIYAFDYLGLAGQPALLIGADLMGRVGHVTIDFRADRVGFGRPRTMGEE